MLKAGLLTKGGVKKSFHLRLIPFATLRRCRVVLTISLESVPPYVVIVVIIAANIDKCTQATAMHLVRSYIAQQTTIDKFLQ